MTAEKTYCAVIVLTVAASFGCGSEPPTSPAAPARVVVRAEPMIVSDSRGTFLPWRDATDLPIGTTFHVKVITKVDDVTIHLAVCGVPCNTAAGVHSWSPIAYAAGEELVWRVPKPGRYYFFCRDPRMAFSTIVKEERMADRLRMTFDSGSVFEAWFVLPS
jgi:hypothetical protein